MNLTHKKSKKNPTFLVLGGYGEMGQITVRDLFKTTKGSVVIAGRDLTAAKKFAAKFKSARVRGVTVDVANTKQLAQIASACDVIINCTQYTFNLYVMRAALIAQKPYLDLGGLFHMTKRQLKLHAQFKKKNILAILGCGSTPGITNILAKKGAEQFDKIHEVHIRFADFDFNAALHTRDTRHASPFTIPYSIQTIFDEFTLPAAVFRKGNLLFVPAMTGEEHEKFPYPVKTVKEFYTLHSEIATLPTFFKSRGIRECDFKVSFDDQFIHDIKLLLQLGLSSKDKKEFNRFIPSGVPDDLEYIRVRMSGTKNGRKKKVTLDCITRSNTAWRAPAGAYDTGVPPSIIAQMIVGKKIHNTGVMAPEQCIDPDEFIVELKKRKCVVQIHVS